MMDEDHIRIREDQKRVASADSMIERVAAEVTRILDRYSVQIGARNRPCSVFDDEATESKALFVGGEEESRKFIHGLVARAAIEAMREPTEVMRKVIKPKTATTFVCRMKDGRALSPSDVYTAMIDAALGPVAKKPLTPDEREAYRWATGRSAP